MAFLGFLQTQIKDVKSGHPFELVNEIGVGAFGSVWKAKDIQLDRCVAVKIPRKGNWTPRKRNSFSKRPGHQPN